MKGREKKPRQDPRTELITIRFSHQEILLIDSLLRRKNIRSRSSYIRKTIMADVLKETGQHKATLFDLIPEE